MWQSAIEAMVRLEVLEAKIVAGRADPVQLMPDSVLQLQLFGDRLDDDVAIPELPELGDEPKPTQRCVPSLSR